MLDPSCVVVLLIMYLLDMCHHVDLLSLYISQQLVTFDVYIVTVLQLAEDIIKCGPDANITILPRDWCQGEVPAKVLEGSGAVYAHVVGSEKVVESCSFSSNSALV